MIVFLVLAFLSFAVLAVKYSRLDGGYIDNPEHRLDTQ
jgi:hypothetical protein